MSRKLSAIKNKGITVLKYRQFGLGVLIVASLCVACVRNGRQPLPVASTTITVYAAASLQDAFKQIGSAFEAQHPGTKAVFNFGGSQQLAEQIGQGAPADVFASANTKLMDTVIKTGRIASGSQQVFAHNRLVLITPKSNPAGMQTLSDLATPGLKLVLAAKAVPVGQYTLDFLGKASATPEFGAAFSQTVLSNVVSYETDVRSVFAKVSLGEADAGIVYSSDVVADKQNTVTRIEIPDPLNTLAVYPIAALKDSPQLELAQQFVAFVRSEAGQNILTRQGFGEAK